MKNSKKWKIKVRSPDGSRVDFLTMIDKDHMSDEECAKHLDNLYGEKRLINFTEVK